MNIASYVFVEDILETTSIQASTKPANLNQIKQICYATTKTFELLARGRVFYPRIYTKRYDDLFGVGYPFSGSSLGYSRLDPTINRRANLDQIIVDDDLLEVDELSFDDGSLVIPSTDYFLKSGLTSYNDLPYDRIVRNNNVNNQFWGNSSDYQKSVSVTGTWGYVPHYNDDAIYDSGITVDSINGNVITINDNSGLNVFGFTPKLRTFNLIKINDEWLFVTDINELDITVIRAVNGSTQGTISNGDSVSIFRILPEVYRACLQLATHIYRNADTSIGDPTSTRRIITAEGVIMPEAIPDIVRDVAKYYRKVYVN